MKRKNLDALLAAPWISLDNTDSTNKYLLEISDTEIINGMTCTSKIQTKGVGRHCRVWNSPAGGLYMSILIIPVEAEKFWHMTSFILACAAAQVIKKHHPDLTPLLKWPNDILINGRKVAGVLVQSLMGNTPRIVAGIGINITTNPIHLPSRPIFPATVINQESCLPASVTSLGKDIRKRFFELYLDWLEDKSSILTIINSLCALKNRTITISYDNQQVTGLFDGINSDGSLRINRNGIINEYRVGDIIRFEEC